MNLFDIGNEYYLAHCISCDFALGKGIAKEFRNRGVAKALNHDYQKSLWEGKGYCFYTPLNDFKGVFNLVTKQKYWMKPTYETLTQSLENMKRHILDHSDGSEVVKLAMPLIGCDLDRLTWSKVKEIINDVFAELNIDITICYL
uniref:ADP-ribose 1''-phosphate phosphatase n=1 Tax=Anaeromyces contortus TaxID=2170304 RepID=A0A2S1TZH3_9FUNG|nr:Macro domain [Anaeromyces contortus]